eukprot:g11548.t1
MRHQRERNQIDEIDVVLVELVLQQIHLHLAPQPEPDRSPGWSRALRAPLVAVAPGPDQTYLMLLVLCYCYWLELELREKVFSGGVRLTPVTVLSVFDNDAYGEKRHIHIVMARPDASITIVATGLQ